MSAKRTSIIWNLSKEDFQKLVKRHDSIASILRHFGLHVGAGNYKTFKRRVKADEIDISHISLGPGANKGKDFSKYGRIQRIPLEDILSNKASCKSSRLKKYLIEDGHFTDTCSKCGMGNTWENEPITLQLDHINGNSQDNRLENLRILCPNCHSQTKTWGAKRLKKKHNCKTCGVSITSKSTYCQKCAGKVFSLPTKISWPSNEDLIQMIKESNIRQVSKRLGVSDNTVRKRLIKRGYTIKNGDPTETRTRF